jgi:hypothetical protein
MLGAITAGLQLATGVLTKINTDNARKLINDCKDLELAILKEEDQGYYSDDNKIETLQKQYAIIMKAALAEYNLYAAK